MVSEEFFQRDEVGFEEWAVTPRPEVLIPEGRQRKFTRNEFVGKLNQDPPAVIISHTDADGLGAAALLRWMTNDNALIFTVDYNEPYGLGDAIEDIDVHLHSTIPVYISDLNLNNDEVVETLVGMENQVFWFDHHQWDEDIVTRLEEGGVQMNIDTDECATSLIAQERDDLPERLQEVAEVTRDIDLWIRDDPRSSDLALIAYAIDREDYIDTITRNGMDHPQWVESALTDKKIEENELHEFAVDTAEIIRDGQLGYNVAFTYVKQCNTSQIGNELVENGDADIAVVMQPNKVSIYSHSENGVFDHCNKVAEKLGGGGHPTASGFPVPVQTFGETAEYWSSSGRNVWSQVLRAIEEVVNEVEE